MNSSIVASRRARLSRGRRTETAILSEHAGIPVPTPTTTTTKKVYFKSRQRRALQRGGSLSAFEVSRPSLKKTVKKRPRAAVPLRDALPPPPPPQPRPPPPTLLHLASAAQAATNEKVKNAVVRPSRIEAKPRSKKATGTSIFSTTSCDDLDKSGVDAWRGNIVDNPVALDVVDKVFRFGGSLLVIGPSGVGKTMALRQATRHYAIDTVHEVSTEIVGGVVAIAKEVEEMVLLKNLPGKRMLILVDGLEQLANKDSKFGSEKKFGREATSRAPTMIMRTLRRMRQSRFPKQKILVFVCQSLPPGWKNIQHGDSAVQHVARFYSLQEKHLHTVLDRLLRRGERSARLSAAYKQASVPLGRNAGVIASRLKKGLVQEAHGDARHLVQQTRFLFNDRAEDPKDDDKTLTVEERARRDAVFSEVIARIAGFDLRLPEARDAMSDGILTSSGVRCRVGPSTTQKRATFPEAAGGMWSAARVLAGGSSKLRSPEDITTLLQTANIQDIHSISKLGELVAAQLADNEMPIVSKSHSTLETLRRIDPSKAESIMKTQTQALEELSMATDDLALMDVACISAQAHVARTMLGLAALRRSRRCFNLDKASHGLLRSNPDTWKLTANYITCQDRALSSYRDAHRRLCVRASPKALNVDGCYVSPLSLLGGWARVDISSIPEELMSKIPGLPPFHSADQSRVMEEAASGRLSDDEF